MLKIAISILNYNNTKDTIDCLDSLARLKVENIELVIYVIDNGSKVKFDFDKTKFKKLDIRLIRSDTNTGFTGGHNIIYKKALMEGFDFFMILNNDCIVEENSLTFLIDGLKGNVGAVVPKIYFTKGHEYHKTRYRNDELGKIIWYAGGKIDWSNVVSKHIGLDDVDKGQFNEEMEIDFATGACVLFTREVLEKVGLFDNRFFLYFEDADLSVRIVKAGFKIMYIPKAIVWHNNAGSSGAGSNLHDYYLTRNKLIFGMKHASAKTKILLIKEALRILLNGRHWQKKGVKDFFTNRLGEGKYDFR